MNLTRSTVIEKLKGKYINTKSASDQVMLYLFAVAVGLKNTDPFKNDAMDGIYDSVNSFYKINNYGDIFSEYPSSGQEIIELYDLARILLEDNTVKLNDKYIAEITDEGVNVGCTTISHGAVLELANKIKKLKNK